MTNPTRHLAFVIGVLVTVQGLFGLAAPGSFLELVSFIQTPPVIYLAAVVRVLFGLVLFLAARGSRAPLPLRVLGIAIVIGGLLTPFFGDRIADVILGSWRAGGPATVRAWALFSLALGAFILYAVTPGRTAARPAG